MTRGQKVVLAVGAVLALLTVVSPPQYSSDRTDGWEVEWGLFALILVVLAAVTAMLWWLMGRPWKK